MKRVLFVLVCAMIGFTAQAQSNTDEVNLFQSAYGMEKKQMISDFMKITPAEATNFWLIYDEYEVARKEYGKKRVNNITEFAKNYSNLSPEKATEIMKVTFTAQHDFAKLLEKYFKKMSKSVSPMRAAQWAQVEMYLENVIRMQILDEIPIIGEFEKAKK
jgi:hypothetical protein